MEKKKTARRYFIVFYNCTINGYAACGMKTIQTENEEYLNFYKMIKDIEVDGTTKSTPTNIIEITAKEHIDFTQTYKQ